MMLRTYVLLGSALLAGCGARSELLGPRDASMDGRNCGPTEICGNGLDDNCNGLIDEGCVCTPGQTEPCYPGDPSQAGIGVCNWGTATCSADTDASGVWGPCVGAGHPEPEVCDGMDYLCNGHPLTGCQCTNGTMQSCYTGPAGTEGVGVCQGGTQTCVPMPDGTGSRWSACGGEVVPSMNHCDGVDRSCTGDPFRGCICHPGMMQSCYDGPTGTQNVGICRAGSQTCMIVSDTAAWGMCMGEVLPQTEICDNGIDDNCNGQVDEGCGPLVSCPPDLSTPAGQAVSLTATATPSANRSIVGETWTITTAPMGGSGTPMQWTPDPPTQATEQFLAYIVGDYTLTFTATDSRMQSASCTTTVHAVGHGLRVELTWDGTGDLDLHLHNGITSTPWYNGSGSNDCYYADRSPMWDSPGTQDDPTLDFDNTTANGPENTRIDSPVVGETYTVAIHNYARGEGRIATVQIFCGDQNVFTRMSHPLQGTNAGDCTENDFWKVATVTFTAPGMCTVSAIDTYGPSAPRCMAF